MNTRTHYGQLLVLLCTTSIVFVVFFISASLAHAQGSLVNPLAGAGHNNITDFVAGALKVLVKIALPVVAFFLVLAGFQYITAQGNASKISDAHRNFTFVVIGGILLLGAWVAATMIGGTVSQVVGG